MTRTHLKMLFYLLPAITVLAAPSYAAPSTYNYYADPVQIGGTDDTPPATVSVDGSMKVGDGGETCDGTTEGAIKYNSGSSIVQYCNGTSWTSLTLNGPPVASGVGYFVKSGMMLSGCLGSSVSSATFVGTTVTLTVGTNQYLEVGDQITVMGATTPELNGTFTITAIPSSTQISYVTTVSSGSTGNAADYCFGSGGLTAANALCLRALTANTNWWGYASANAAGLLTGSKVKAFLCDDSTCNNLQPSTTYYMAGIDYNADNDTVIGGASFTTDVSGAGPNNNEMWGQSTHLGLSGWYASIYTGRDGAGGTSSAWPTATSGTNTCSSWTTNSSGTSARVGLLDRTTNARWQFTTLRTCNNEYMLVCYVDP